MILSALLAAFLQFTPLPTPSATPTFFATPSPTPVAEAGPSASCIMSVDVATCTVANLNHARQLAVDGTLIGSVQFNGQFTITFAAGSGTHKIYVEGFAPISVVAP